VRCDPRHRHGISLEGEEFSGPLVATHKEVTRKALFRDGHHRTNDRIARLRIRGKFGEISYANGYHLRDRTAFCLASVRSSVLAWHLATRSLRLRRL
jgi:hypothetical protein